MSRGVTALKDHLIQAAERGDAEAQFNLAMIYENGLDDSRYAAEGNRPEAMRWFRAAADQGLARAQLKLAEICAGEHERPESSVEACGWYLLATASLRGAHLQKAQSDYQRVALRLTTDQSAEVSRFAQSWKPKSGVSPSSDEYEISGRARA
jgi:TPR repeat protein